MSHQDNVRQEQKIVRVFLGGIDDVRIAGQLLFGVPRVPTTGTIFGHKIPVSAPIGDGMRIVHVLEDPHQGNLLDFTVVAGQVGCKLVTAEQPKYVDLASLAIEDAGLATIVSRALGMPRDIVGTVDRLSDLPMKVGGWSVRIEGQTVTTRHAIESHLKIDGRPISRLEVDDLGTSTLCLEGGGMVPFSWKAL